MEPETLTYATALFAGIVSFLSPCVLPLVPPYLGYMAGTTIDQMTAEESISRTVWRKAVVSSLFFILGFGTVFVLLGLTASYLGQLLLAYKWYLGKVAGVIIIIMGLHFLGVFKIALFYKEARVQSTPAPASLGGAYLMGLAFAFGWTPCIGPILTAILGMAAVSEQMHTGTMMLVFYTIGLGIPFLLAAMLIQPFMTAMRGFRQYLGTVEKVMGGFLIIVGIMFLTDRFTVLAVWLTEMFPVLLKLG